MSFADAEAPRISYSFDWDLEPEYWYSKEELKAFNEVRFDEADVLRKERGIRTSSRNDADELSTSRRDIFIVHRGQDHPRPRRRQRRRGDLPPGDRALRLPRAAEGDGPEEEGAQGDGAGSLPRSGHAKEGPEGGEARRGERGALAVGAGCLV